MPPPAGFSNFIAAGVGGTPGTVTSKGRTLALPTGGLAFDFQNAGAGVTVSGATALLAAINQTNPAGTALPVGNRLAVTVVWNGQVDRSSVLETAAGTAYYTLVAGLNPSQTYTVWVTKISEASWNEGTIQAPEWLVLYGFATDGAAAVGGPPLPSRRLEFIGDSLTAGACCIFCVFRLAGMSLRALHPPTATRTITPRRVHHMSAQGMGQSLWHPVPLPGITAGGTCRGRPSCAVTFQQTAMCVTVHRLAGRAAACSRCHPPPPPPPPSPSRRNADGSVERQRAVRQQRQRLLGTPHARDFYVELGQRREWWGVELFTLHA